MQHDISISGDERLSFSTAAGDLHAVIGSDRVVTWWSDDRAVGEPLADALVADDGRLLDAALTDRPTGPHWLRLRDSRGRGHWMAVLAVPRADGWALEFRDVRALGPAVGAPYANGGISTREQVLAEVAWMLAAEPRTGREVAVIACELTELPAVTREMGRLASEEVIEVITGRMTDDLRSGDVVARIDANRLLVVVRGVHGLPDAVDVVRRLQDVVAEPVILDAGEVGQTFAAGITLIRRGENVYTVLDRSEEALAEAVEIGPSGVVTRPPS